MLKKMIGVCFLLFFAGAEMSQLSAANRLLGSRWLSSQVKRPLFKGPFTAHQKPRTELVKIDQKLPFGSTFTDHMFVMEWDKSNGWHSAQIIPYTERSFALSTNFFHYGASIFEGMKAHRTKDGKIAIFRPADHFQRFNESAARMCMPLIDVDFAIVALRELLKIDQLWVPAEQGTALYIRPTMIGTEPKLGVNGEIASYLFYILLSPMTSLYGNGFKPVSIMVTEEFCRAAPGGTGAIKAAGNYGGAKLAQRKAAEAGFDQVLWLDPVERTYVEEVGAMNIFCVIDGKLVTPALNGTILPGITRRSVLACAADLGFEVEERRVSINELLKCIQDGTCTEIFGTGTAAIIAPVGRLGYRDKTYIVNNEQAGPVAETIFTHLSQLYCDEALDDKGWLTLV